MIKYFCDKCGRKILGERYKVYLGKLTDDFPSIVPLDKYNPKNDFCKECIGEIKKFIED